VGSLPWQHYRYVTYVHKGPLLFLLVLILLLLVLIRVSCPTSTIQATNCPSSNETIKADSTCRKYMILCDTEINTGYHQTPAVASGDNIEACMTACTDYGKSHGAACGAVSFAYGSLCYFYGKIYPVWNITGAVAAVLVTC